MKEKLPRGQFQVAFLDARMDRAEPTLNLLKQAGYRPRYYSSLIGLLEELDEAPPHILLIQRNENPEEVGPMLTALHDRLPETHFIVLTSSVGLAQAWREWGSQIYDCVMMPTPHPDVLVRAVDRAAEIDTWMYKCEDLEAKVTELENKSVSVAASGHKSNEDLIDGFSVSALDGQGDTRKFLAELLDSHSESKVATPVVQTSVVATEVTPIPTLSEQWSENLSQVPDRLRQAQSLDELAKLGLGILLEGLSTERPAVFLRYLSNRRCLVASTAQHLPAEAWKGLGLDLSQEPDFRESSLRHPETFENLRELGMTLNLGDQLWVRPMVVRQEVYGLFLIFAPNREIRFERQESVMQLIQDRGELLDLRQTLHAVDQRDPGTLLLQRPHFLSRLGVEIQRARRIEKPVSLLIISLDQHRDILSRYGLEESQLALRALAKIILPRSRALDILGRVSADEMGLILPHTSREGAKIKAERIRRLVEAADFGRVLPHFAKLTVTVGLSEYPSCSRDMDDLFSTADDVLWNYKGKMGNRVALASPVPGFVPDFVLPNAGPNNFGAKSKG